MAEDSNPPLKKSIADDSIPSLSDDEPSKEEVPSAAASKPEVQGVKFSDRIIKYPNNELKIFETNSEIGSGSFGRVRKYHHKDKIVAVKEFFITGDDEAINNVWNMVQREANILCRFHHQNIIEIQGITQWPNIIGIIMEYVDGGNLQKLLSKGNQSDLPWKSRMDIASGITSGLDYIHNYDETKTFCHGDLKPANVLLTQSLQVKLADFGSAAFHRATAASTTTIKQVSTTQFTLIYVAPEFLEDNTRKRNPTMDMYSFAMVLYELISRKAPYSDSAMPMHVPGLIIAKVKPSMKLIDSAENQLETDDDRAAFSFLKKLMQRCWNNNPESRPSSKTVKMDLSSFTMNLSQGFSPQIDGSQNAGAQAATSEGGNASETKSSKPNFQSSTSRASGRPSWFGQDSSVLIGNQESVEDLLAKYTDSLLNFNFEEADMFRAALRSLIVEGGNAEAKNLLLFAEKLQREEKYLQSIVISDTAAALHAKMKNPEEDMEKIQYCIQEIRTANGKMIEEDSNMKVIVREHVIPLMHNWVHVIKGASQVSEKWKCHNMCWVLYHIDLSLIKVDQHEEGKQALEEAVSEMRRVFGHDVHKQHGRLFGAMLNNLGVRYKRESRFEEAADLFKESIQAHQAGLDYFGDEGDRKRDIDISERALKSISRELWEKELKMK